MVDVCRQPDLGWRALDSCVCPNAGPVRSGILLLTANDR